MVHSPKGPKDGNEVSGILVMALGKYPVFGRLNPQGGIPQTPTRTTLPHYDLKETLTADRERMAAFKKKWLRASVLGRHRSLRAKGRLT